MRSGAVDGTNVEILVGLSFIGLLIYLFFVSAMICMMRGGRMMCMGRHSHDSEEMAGLRRPVEDLREYLEEASGDAVRSQHTEHGEGNLA